MKRNTLAFLVAALSIASPATATDEASHRIEVVNGVVTPKRPIAEAIIDAMQFLKKADGDYVPGSIDGPLAGYFTSAHVNADGSRTNRHLAFPARQHAYFISTFLQYYAYSSEEEWLLRARDLADWNLAHFHPLRRLLSQCSVFNLFQWKTGRFPRWQQHRAR